MTREPHCDVEDAEDVGSMQRTEAIPLFFAAQRRAVDIHYGVVQHPGDDLAAGPRMCLLFVLAIEGLQRRDVQPIIGKAPGHEEAAHQDIALERRERDLLFGQLWDAHVIA
ncbi:hypothetical protein A9977_14630 [Variovorax sp. UMC13]|nr:hypothetical protein [Variovorax sp. UMC13]